MRGLGLAACITWAAAVGTIAAQSPARPDAAARIWQGVYTTAQAERGKSVYEGACIRCHGSDLGGTTAPPLKGDRFLANWGGETVGRLFEKIRDTMPPNFSTTLDDAAKIQIVAYILQTNGFPAGAGELAPGPTLAAIPILRQGEQPQVQNFSLVETIGCLARENGAWILRSASTPVAATSDAPTADALAAAASIPAGAESYVLLNAAPFDPAGQLGRRVEARGLIYQQPGDSLITVTSLRAVGSCV